MAEMIKRLNLENFQKNILTERKMLLRGVVVNLQSGVGARATEPDHVVLAVVHLGSDVPHRDVFRSQVVIDVNLSGALKKKSFPVQVTEMEPDSRMCIRIRTIYYFMQL